MRVYKGFPRFPFPTPAFHCPKCSSKWHPLLHTMGLPLPADSGWTAVPLEQESHLRSPDRLIPSHPSKTAGRSLLCSSSPLCSKATPGVTLGEDEQHFLQWETPVLPGHAAPYRSPIAKPSCSCLSEHWTPNGDLLWVKGSSVLGGVGGRQGMISSLSSNPWPQQGYSYPQLLCTLPSEHSEAGIGLLDLLDMLGTD